MGKIIKQTAVFDVSPDQVYETLMDSSLHEKFTGEKAKISQKVGGKFTAYGEYIEGTNVELKPGKKIVQKWRASDWPKGHFSIATFAMEKKGKGTKLTFTQTDVPEEQYDSISQGWKDYYWSPMKELFAEK